MDASAALEERLRLAGENCPFLFAIYDAQGCCRFMNAAGRQLVVRSEDEYHSHTDDALWSGETAMACVPALKEALATSKAQTVEFVLPGTTNQVHLAATYVPFPSPDGVVEYVLVFGFDITARERAEAALREADESIAYVLRSITDSYFVLNNDWKFKVVNPAAEQTLFHCSAVALYGRVIWQAYPQLAGTIFEEQLKTAINQGHPVHFEGLWPIGSKWLEAHAYPQHGRIEVYLRDITARKKAEQALAASERRFRALTEKSGDPISMLDSKGTILYETSGGNRSLNYPLGALIGHNAFELMHPEDMAATMQMFEDLLRHPGSSTEVECRVRASDGSWRVFQMIGTNLLHDPDIGGIVLNSHDITERKHAEKALREAHDQLEERVRERTSELEAANAALTASEERFRQMAESVEEVFWLVDSRMQRTLYISPAYEKIWGRPCQSLYDTPESWYEAIHPDDRPQIDKFMAKSSLSSGFNGEYRVVRPDGSIRWVWDRAVPLLDTKGHLRLLVCVARDITERKELEKEILSAAERQQQRIGQEIHDSLCQQLTGIGFLADSLAERLQVKKDPAAKDAADIASLLKDAMAHSRHLARGLFPVELDAAGLMTALEQLAQKTTALFRIVCRFRCDWNVHIRDSETAMHLYRISQEAVHNASRHSQATRMSISLLQKKGRITLCIKDNGRGFDADTDSEGIGLKSMHYRAKLIGAALDIKRNRPNGTIIQCSLANP